MDGDRVALEEELALVARIDPADAFDQRRLAGAVVTDERGDLAGRYGEIHVLQDLYGAEPLHDPARFKQRCHGASYFARSCGAEGDVFPRDPETPTSSAGPLSPDVAAPTRSLTVPSP
ncbi:hypothetical protein Psuf_041310 [Phytohabitans suffuscus]|uniref:Uncharacterized protein n=1 Tax=Phytohabitans suffuscus TaxID=624315 RepID=A0A6F8YLI0_9ACTN|nr:hypothetical protein Psuf_041310 [Phytohabitans suffuscus]